MRKIIAILLFGGLGLVGFGQTSPCLEIDSTFDKFEEVRRFYSPYLEKVTLTKVIYKNKTVSYFLGLTAESYSHTPGDDVVVLFEGGLKFEWPNEEIEIDISDGKYHYQALLHLTKDEIKFLTLKKITDFKIGIHQVLDVDGARYQQFLKCLIKIK